MGLQKDHIFKDFFKDAKRFADMMNAILYGGQNVIQPEELQLMDSNEIFVGKYISKERRRDVIMLWKGKTFRLFLHWRHRVRLTLQWCQEHFSMMH